MNVFKSLKYTWGTCSRKYNHIINRKHLKTAMSKSDNYSQTTGDGNFLTIGDYSVFAWSLSGIETSVVIKKQGGFSCCFDMGYASRESVKCGTVLISHGHMDHISAVPQHIKKRELMSAPSADYYVPEHLVGHLSDICQQFSAMNENCHDLEHTKIHGVNPGMKIELPKGHFAIPFKTYHRVISQGYILYKNQKSLKPEFQGLKSHEIGQKVKNGEIVNDINVIPEVAFTGDTTFEVFTNSPPPDLFKVKLLIVEATYMDEDEKNDKVEQARFWGHIHLSEIFENAALFRDVENILLIHFSDKYSCRYINKIVYGNIPEELKGKVHVATLAKERYL